MRSMRVMAGVFVLGLLALATPTRAVAGATAIKLEVLHADCTAAGAHTFSLFVNDHLVGTMPSNTGCDCTDVPASTTFTDPTALSWFNPEACNAIRMNVSSRGSNLALG